MGCKDHRPSCHSEGVERLMQGLRSGQGAGTFLSSFRSVGQAPALGLGSLGESLKGLERFKNKHRVLGLGFEIELRSREKI